MKKIKLLIFTVLVFLISVSGVSATKRLTCSYKFDSDYPLLSLVYDKYILNSDLSSVSLIYGREIVSIDFMISGDTSSVEKILYKYKLCPIMEKIYTGQISVLEPGTPEKAEHDNCYSSEYFKEADFSDVFSVEDINISESTLKCPEHINVSLDYEKITKYSELYNYHTHKLISTSTAIDMGVTPCYNYKKESSCDKSENNGIACVWNENENAPNGGYCNVDNLLYVSCGDARDIPYQVPGIISMIVNLLKIATPIILIFVSIITLLKALAASKEDEIKKAQSSLIKKIIAAAMVFFVVSIVQFVVSKVASASEKRGFSKCLSCFLNNSCESTTYYKTVVQGIDYCTPLTTGETYKCPTK